MAENVPLAAPLPPARPKPLRRGEGPASPLEGEEVYCAGTNLVVRLSRNDAEIEASQRLRYRVFHDEFGATFSPEVEKTQRDVDAYDPYCDHLLVVDTSDNKERVVGCYRLLRRSAMEKLGRFYSESEYDISALKKLDMEILELGRSCVEEAYRSRAAMALLWRGIGQYVEKYAIGLMFGCASFTGIDPQAHANALSYLYHNHLAPEDIRARALPELYQSMNLMPKETVDAKAAFGALPPLIKGYLRLGGSIGDGAVIDPLCKSVDVNIVVPTKEVSDKYVQRYAGPETKKRINSD